MPVKQIAILIVLLFSSLTAHATLVDVGSNGEYFHDTNSGLYWWDTAQFVGDTKTEIDTYVNLNSNWKYATAAEIDTLSGQSSAGGVPLTDIMGAHQFEISSASDGNGSRWIGYFDETSAPSCPTLCPDGWLAQTVLGGGLNDVSTIGGTGFQGNVITWGPGAWVNSTLNPVPVPAAVWLFGTALIGLVGFSKRRKAA
jgi:hypothetical protein